MMRIPQVIAASTLLFGLVYGDTCSIVLSTSSIEVDSPLSLEYTTEQADYWSSSCASLIPTCIVFPKSADEVATVIKVLNDNNETFAIKSGGHNPNNYFSSVQGGPLISTQRMDQVVLDQDTGIARVGPGIRLDEIAAELQGTGWTFVGGRIGNTGVGGLVLGGGLSYMSAQYGWAASSVIEYEIVLANGTVTTVSATQNPDLFKALKGGGNNFGVVTTYVLQTYRQGDIYGGNLVFDRTPETDTALLKAVRDFTEYNEDDTAAVIVTAERSTANAIDSWIIFIFYDGTVPPEETFKNFTDVGPTLNTLRTQTYAELIGGSNWVIVKASVVDISTETIPIPSAENGDFIDELHAHWRNVSGTVQLEPGIVASIAYQPFPKRIAAAAKERSVDLIDADDDVNKLIIEINYSFTLQTDYDKMADVIESTYTGVRERVLEWTSAGKLPETFLPLFSNYGFYRQDYYGRLKPENAQFAKTVAAEVDPTGFFRDRTGGFRP
ncbi:putative FAD-binding PCMH-type domain-containing protein [Seiridium unicorne]|uniref:FAD-binding PCMH-type domain-containing protein n=1 Tax=Seiridium unicorne TaxID=138068 RepID=A0ABR2V1X0_9PEZI